MDFLFGRQDFAGENAQQNCFLLANGLGGYCSLSAAFSATRNDHAFLMACLRAPTARFDLVHRLSEQLDAGGQRLWLSTQDKAGAPAEDGWRHLILMDAEVPCWVYEAEGVRVTRRVAIQYGANTAAVRYTIENGSASPCPNGYHTYFNVSSISGGRIADTKARYKKDMRLKAKDQVLLIPNAERQKYFVICKVVSWSSGAIPAD